MTLLALRGLLTLHFFLGMLLIGPVLLKIGSTGYRFVRYYAGAAPYVHKGRPSRSCACSGRSSSSHRSPCWAPGSCWVSPALAAGPVIALLTIHLAGAWDARLAFH